MTMISTLSGCNLINGGGTQVSDDKISALTYTKPVRIADMQTWHSEIRTESTNSSSKTKKNNAPTENGLVVCPYYTLKVNGKSVPIYTTRCSESPHSYAWIDVDGAPETFTLDVELTTVKEYKYVVVLPEKSGVTAELKEKTVKAQIKAYGDYSFAFAANGDKYPTVKNEPLTLMVAPQEKLTVPEGYDVQTFTPQTYGYDDLVCENDNTVYVFKAGEYDIRRIHVNKRKNVMFYFEPGTYISVYETPTIGLDEYDIAGPVFGIHNSENVEIRGRALFDFSAVRGWFKKPDGTDQDMTQYVFNFYKNKDMYISGITTINSNHWTFRICGCEDVLAEWNMMLGYRNYSDGFIYSDCKNCTARNMFARTGDDGIEVKALGWHGWWDPSVKVASNIVFEKCTVWNDAAAAFGVIYENYEAVDGVIFRDCSVGFTSCAWSSNNSSLNVRLTYPGTAHWKNITFDGFEIYETKSNVFTLEWHLKGGSVENLLVKNITVTRKTSGFAGIRLCVNTDNLLKPADMASVCKNVVFENINFRGKVMTEADKDNSIMCSFAPTIGYKDVYTIK